MILHKHHLVPKHAGGPDTPDNVVLVNVAMHAFLHELRYKEIGDKRDWLAAQGLRGIIGKEEIVLELSKLSRRFIGKRHSEETKQKISESLRSNEEFVRASAERLRILGSTSKHKRDPGPATIAASGPNKRQYMRQHWTKEAWDEVSEKFLSRTSFHWGKMAIARKYNISAKTIDNMIALISQGIDWDTATQWNGGDS